MASKQLIVLMRYTSDHSSTVCSSSGVFVPVTPIFAKKTSSPPNSDTQRPTIAATFSSIDASTINADAIPPSPRIVAAVSSVLPARPTTSTAAPSRAKRIALARPIPPPPPVTTARLPSSRFMPLLLSGRDRPATVGRDDGALDVARVIACEERGQRSDFFRRAEAPARHLGLSCCERRFIELRDRSGSGDHARRDNVDADLLRTQLNRGGAGKADDAGLQRRIGNRILGRMKRGHGAQVHDRAAAASLHLRGYGLRRPDQAVHAHSEHALDRLNLDLRKRLKARPDRIVDQYGDRRGKLAFNPREQSVDIVALADVDLISPGFAPLVPQLVDCRFETARADVDTGDASAFPAEALGDRKADPARGTGDDAHAIL